MKFLFTLFLLALILNANGQVNITASGIPGPATKIQIRCSASVNSSDQPLYVVDGVPVESFLISEMNLNEILTINILKNSNAIAICGGRGQNGIILITTKSGAIRKLKIEDATDFSPVAGASVTMRKGNDTTVMIADEKGMIAYEWSSSMEGGEAEVSCIGYEKTPLHLSMKREQVVKLFRKQAVMDPVIIEGYARTRRICCGGTCSIITKNNSSIISNQYVTFSIFPNPSVAGKTIQIKLADPFTGNASLYNMAGQMIKTVHLDAGKGIYQRFSLPNASAGTYVIMLTDEKNLPVGNAKVILQ